MTSERKLVSILVLMDIELKLEPFFGSGAVLLFQSLF